MDWMVEVELSEFMTPSNANTVLDLCMPLRDEFLDWERVSFDYLHNSFLGTSVAGDSFVAVQ